jgi:RNA polymerase sigma-70 factor (ECF subfamily)
LPFGAESFLAALRLTHEATMGQPGDWIEERHRNLLKLYVRQYQLDARLRRRLDSSELVQDALLKAVQNAHQLRDQAEGARIKWLQVILKNVVIDRIRHEFSQGWDAGKEQDLVKAAEESSVRLENQLAAKDPSPSSQAAHHEFLFRLAVAIEQLPERQRDVVILKHQDGLKVAEIAQHLGEEPKIVSNLLYRGEAKLCELMPEYKPGQA